MDTGAVPQYRFNRQVTDQEYRGLVRKYKPSSFLPLVAAYAARYGGPGDPWLNSPYRIHTPWALADVARVSLAYGLDFGRADATDDDLLTILAAYDSLDDPFRRESDRDEALRGFLLRKAGEQFAWQAPEYSTLARSAAVFSHTVPNRPLKYILPGWDVGLFGCSLSDYVGAAQLLWASALACNGHFDPALFSTPDGERISRHVDKAAVLHALDTHFAIDKAEFRVKDEEVRKRTAHRNPQLRRYTFNTLRSRPAVTGFGRGYLCPGPKLVLSKASPWGLYFSGLERFGTDFTTEIGYFFEQYIGRQLALLDAQVLPEIRYKEGKQYLDGVDWIVVFDDLVLLVEVKSVIPTEPVLLGTSDATEHIVGKLKKAYRQINKTAGLIKDRRPEFQVIPGDRPILGMAVTLEPFYLTEAPFLRYFLPETQVPVSVASAAEIEELVTITDSPISALLLERNADEERSTWSVGVALQGHERHRNPILEAGWNTYPWASVFRSTRDAGAASTPGSDQTSSGAEGAEPSR
jgi:hypothetical protein